MLVNNLKAAGYEQATVLAALAESGIDPLARAEALPLESFARLHHALQAV